jgi:hypothetical protein
MLNHGAAPRPFVPARPGDDKAKRPPEARKRKRRCQRHAVRRRSYVDFDKCLPYFNEAMSCAICLAVCPFSRPGVGGNLVMKLATRRARGEG